MGPAPSPWPGAGGRLPQAGQLRAARSSLKHEFNRRLPSLIEERPRHIPASMESGLLAQRVVASGSRASRSATSAVARVGTKQVTHCASLGQPSSAHLACPSTLVI